VMMWPAFPFHPHLEGNSESNRTPTKDELKIGGLFLTTILQELSPKHIIAIGRKAEIVLNDLNKERIYVRHPANGGARKFREGIEKLLPVQKASVELSS
ncbi:MAG: uracil-DNA glycosylase, partial [Chitinophagaceae bacterium]